MEEESTPRVWCVFCRLVFGSAVTEIDSLPMASSSGGKIGIGLKFAAHGLKHFDFMGVFGRPLLAGSAGRQKCCRDTPESFPATVSKHSREC